MVAPMLERQEHAGKSSSGLIQAVDRAIMILESFSIQHQELGVTEIAQRLGLKKSTVHGLLSTLEKRGFLEKDPNRRKYQLGLKLLELGSIKLEGFELVKIAHPVLEEVAGLYKETVHMGIYDLGEVVYVDKIDSANTLKIITYVGKRNPVYCTGVGKCLLSFQNEEEVERVIQKGLHRFTANTITDPEKLHREIEIIRRNGYALDMEEIEVGLVCVAAPIKDYKGKVLAAISVAGPRLRMNDEQMQAMIQPVCASALKISMGLGYRGE